VAARRPYQAPRLCVHGDVQTLTRKEGVELDLDGGGSFTPEIPLAKPTTGANP
jgi:hypothetical protein